MGQEHFPTFQLFLNINFLQWTNTQKNAFNKQKKNLKKSNQVILFKHDVDQDFQINFLIYYFNKNLFIAKIVKKTVCIISC